MIPLLSEIQRTLLHEWDPIGVRDAPSASDEYDRYAFEIFVMLQGRTPASAHEIAACLNRIQSEHMGLDLTAAHNEEVAALIAAL